MEYTSQRGRSTRASSPPAAYPGHARPYTTDAVSGDRVRARANRPASASRASRPASGRKPEAAANSHSINSPKASSNLDEITDLRKLLHVASEIQNIDLEAALNLYKGLMKKTKNDELMKSEETYLEQLTSEVNTSVRTELEEKIDALSQENDELKREKTSLEKVQKQSKSLLELMQRMETESEKHKADLKRKEDELRKLKEEKVAVIAEKNEALTRLSKELGTKLSDNNPAIADLSDPNRAMKLGEKYNELYDNQWTDAMEILCADFSDEERNVKKLLDVFKKCYELCVDLSETQMASLEMVLLNPGVSTRVNYPKDVSSPTIAKSTYKQLKDFRKEVSPLAVGNIFKEHARTKIGLIAETIPEFVKKSIEVCWLMCAQDPPVVIGSEAVVSDTFDGNVYKAYTNSGTVVSYNVWLPLLLHKDGPLLVKGIVQPIKVHRQRKRTEEAKPKKPVVADRLRSHRPGETYHSPYSQTSTQRVTTTKPAMQYEKPKVDRNGTSPPSEKNYGGGHTRKNYEEYGLHNAAEDRDSPVHLAIQSNYRSRPDTYGTTPQTNYQQHVVRKPYEPYTVDHNGTTYVCFNGQRYLYRDYLRIFGTTSGVSDS